MKTLYFEPTKEPIIKDIPYHHASLAAAVGGPHRILLHNADPIAVVLNKDGEGQPNRHLFENDGSLTATIYGNFFVCGFRDNALVDIPDSLIDTYRTAFGPAMLQQTSV